jgi:tetratricopeptide (TPR) repeat protein
VSVLSPPLDELGFPITQIPTGASDRAALLRHALANRRILVVLDNVRDSAHVRPLLDAVPDCPTLITSRQRLTGLANHDGVQQLTVPPLAPAEAESLLNKRIGRRAADDPTAISRLVALCDGLPLALRIVSEHVTLRPAPPIADLVDELGHTKRLLDAGQHGDEHSTTLRSAFSWSYQALRPDKRRLFRLLGLLPGSRFSVPAAAAVSGLDRSDVEQGLDELLGAHLVEQEHAGRYRTHDLLHRFARACVRDDEPETLRQQAFRRMLDWYFQTAQRGWTYLVADRRPVPDLAPEEPVEALSFTSNDDALRWFVVERANLFSLVHLAADQGFHEHVWRLSGCLHVLSKFEDPHPFLAIHELGRRSAAQAGQVVAEAGCLNNLGTVYGQLNDDLRAGRCFELAAHAFHVAGDTHAEAIGMHNIGTIHLKLGAPKEAIGWFRKAITIFTRVADQWAIANTLRRLGDAHRKLDQHREAASSYRQSLFTCQKIDDLRGQGATLSRLAGLSLDQYDLDNAIAYGTEALDMFDRIQVDQDGKAAALHTMAATYLSGGDYSKAIRMATEAVRTYQSTGNTSAEIDALLLLCRTQATSGEHTQAAAAGLAAIALLDTPDDPRAAELHTLLRLPTGQPVPTPRSADDTDRGHSNPITADEITGNAT